MSTQPKTFLTPEEYLEIERKAESKSEYYQGEMYAIAGARQAHNLIVTNVLRELSQQLRSRPCELYPNDMRIQVSSTGLFTYPDASVVCETPRFVDGVFDTLINPIVIAEVLSSSTEAYDRGFKFNLYKSVESFKEYLLLSSEYMHVDLFTRQADARWLLTSVSQPEETIELQSIDCRLKLADLYEKVEFVVEPRGQMRPLNPA